MPAAVIALAVWLHAAPALGQGGADGGVVVPPTLLRDSPAPYPAELREQRLAGLVTLRLTLDESGGVTDVALVQASHPAFGLSALAAARTLRFTPTLLDGAPRPSQLDFTYRFEAPPPPVLRVLVKGQVRSRGTRAPIALARVFADDGTETLTDGAGRFTLELPPGKHLLHALASGFLTGSFEETLVATRELEVVYGLTPLRLNPFQTVVRGERDRTEVSRVELHDAELREVPGTMGDPFRVVMVLPGVSSIISGVAYPVVRGSSPASTGYFLDGVRVPALFHVFLGPAVVHPDFIDGLDFYAGGAPAKYGRLLGGVIEGTLAKPRDGFHATAYADLLNAGAFVEVPIEKTDTRLTAAGRISYMGLLVGALSPLFSGPQGPSLVADFWDYQARLDQGLLGGRLQLFGFGSGDTFGTTSKLVDGPSLAQDIVFHRADAKYRHRLGPGELLAELTFGHDEFALGATRTEPLGGLEFPGTIGPSPRSLVTTTQRAHITQTSLTAKLQYRAELGEDWVVSAAGTYDHLRAGFTEDLEVQVEGFPKQTSHTEAPFAVGNLYAVWGEATYRGVKDTSATLGLRLDHYHLVPAIGHTTLDPRFSVDRQVTDTLTVRSTIGLYHQPPTFLISLPVVDLAGAKYGVQEVLQVTAGATWRVWRNLELSADAYVNPMTRTAELGLFDDEHLDPSNLPNSEKPLGTPSVAQSRPGLAYGLDLMARWPMQGRWFGWLTLSLQRSSRLASFTTYDVHGRRTGEALAQVPYAFDQTLVANAVVSYRFDSGWSVGATLHFNTGRPESGELTSRTRLEGTDVTGAPAWVRVSRDQVARLPPYFRADLRVAKTWIFDAFTLEAWLDVLNVTVSGEVISYGYTQPVPGALAKTPLSVPIVIPTLGLKARY